MPSADAFFSIFNAGDTLRLFMDLLGPDDLVRYSRVSKSFRCAYIDYCRRTFTLFKILAGYLSKDDIPRFQKLQQRTGVVISGSAALASVDRRVFRGSDCDMYVDVRNYIDVVRWLRNAGYTLIPGLPNSVGQLPINAVRGDVVEEEDDPTAHSAGVYSGGVECVYTFAKLAPGTVVEDADFRVIDLVVCKHSIANVILNFHSTVVMNVGFYAPDDEQDRRPNIAGREKYMRRGWTLSTVPGTSNAYAECASGMRHFGDSLCWTIPLQVPYRRMDILQDIALLSDPITSNSWCSVFAEEGFSCRFIKPKTPMLNNAVVVGGIGGTGDVAWWARVSNELQRVALFPCFSGINWCIAAPSIKY
ncbi:hypothetical protein HGRIS_001395 [Hohenbuehelia grisea]|uniref:F-box domain-containing protein n=1 Tax=Hohenbuehelia grisea TaxID=104357 RepID=A0ABR3JPD5_9AGAR